MENNSSLKPVTHSYQARIIVEQLAIGFLIAPAPTFKCRIIDFHSLSPNIGVFTFKADDRVPGLQSYYSDFSMLGRHF